MLDGLLIDETLFKYKLYRYLSFLVEVVHLFTIHIIFQG